MSLQSLHECIEICLSLFTEHAYKGHQCRAESYTQILVHFVLAFCVADIPETKDTLGVSKGGETKFLCHRCKNYKKNLHLFSLFPRSGKLLKESTGMWTES